MTLDLLKLDAGRVTNDIVPPLNSVCLRLRRGTVGISIPPFPNVSHCEQVA